MQLRYAVALRWLRSKQVARETSEPQAVAPSHLPIGLPALTITVAGLREPLRSSLRPLSAGSLHSFPGFCEAAPKPPGSEIAEPQEPAQVLRKENRASAAREWIVPSDACLLPGDSRQALSKSLNPPRSAEPIRRAATQFKRRMFASNMCWGKLLFIPGGTGTRKGCGVGSSEVRLIGNFWPRGQTR